MRKPFFIAAILIVIICLIPFVRSGIQTGGNNVEIKNTGEGSDIHINQSGDGGSNTIEIESVDSVSNVIINQSNQ